MAQPILLSGLFNKNAHYDEVNSNSELSSQYQSDVS